MGILDEVTSAALESATAPRPVSPAGPVSGGGGLLDSVAAGAAPSPSVMRPMAREEDTPQAGMGALFKSSFADSPETKIRIFSKARGIPEDRYGVVSGHIVYVGDDGKMYKENPTEGWGNAIRSALATTGGQMPGVALGTAGAAFGGIPGAAAGSGAGEVVRKGIGKVVFDDPEPVSEWGGDVAMATAVGAAAEIPGWAIRKLVDRRALKDLAKYRTPDGRLTPEIEAAMAQARAQGIDLTPAELTGNRSLRNQQATLMNLPGEAPATMEDFYTRRGGQVADAFNRQMDAVSPMSPDEAWKRGADASRKGIEALDAARSDAARPLYEQAMATAGPVDIPGVVQGIDADLKKLPAGSHSARTLTRVRQMLVEGEKKLPNGTVVIKPASDLGKLDVVKKEIDMMLDGPEGASIIKDVKRRLTEIKDGLTVAMDNASPEYQQGRAVYGGMSPDVEAAASGITGRLAKREGDDLAKATRDIFSSEQTSPQSVTRAKALIAGQDPEAWNGIVRARMQEVFEGVAKEGDNTNLGNALFRKMFGTKRQAAIWAAALDQPQYEAMRDLMDVLRKTGLAMKEGSPTAPRMIALRDMAADAQPMVYRGARMARTAATLGRSELLEDLWLSRHAAKLADIVTSPDGMNRLKELKAMPANSAKALQGLSELVGATGYYAADGATPDTYENMPIPSDQPTAQGPRPR